MLLAMAIVLELVSKSFIPEMPFGGQVTLVSMLPVVLISYRHGVKWGLVSGVCYALIEMVLGAKTVAATPSSAAKASLMEETCSALRCIR